MRVPIVLLMFLLQPIVVCDSGLQIAFAQLTNRMRRVLYWRAGHRYSAILMFLSVYHGISWTMRQVKYFIDRKLHLRRKLKKPRSHHSHSPSPRGNKSTWAAKLEASLKVFSAFHFKSHLQVFLISGYVL